MRLYLDYGHGGEDLGAIFEDRKESMENLSIGKKLASELRRRGIEVGETRTEDLYVSLDQRVKLANQGNYDYFISIHRNSSPSTGPRGVEVFVAERCNAKAVRLARSVQKGLVRLGFWNRGVKKKDFYVLKRTIMPAILIEIGFINNPIDNYLFDTCQTQIVETLAKSIIDQVNTKL